MADTLTRRALNRATLDRQLLRRHARPARQAVARPAGLQAQAPLAPYTGLRTRLQDFKPENLSYPNVLWCVPTLTAARSIS